MQPTKKIWFDGAFVPWEDAKVHVLTHALHYGYAIFEGIRCNSTPKGPAVFRLREHIKRLVNGTKVYRMKLPFTEERARPGLPRPGEAQRPQRLLRPPDRLQLLRGDGGEPDEEQDLGRDSSLGVGRLSRRRRDGEGHPVRRSRAGRESIPGLFLLTQSAPRTTRTRY